MSVAKYGELLRQSSSKSNVDTSDPAAVYAQITRQQYDDFYKDFGDLEKNLIGRSQNDTSLVDQAKKDAPKAAALGAGIAERNAGRYGIGLLPDQLKARGAETARAGALGYSDAVNNARVAQKDVNDSLLSKIIDIGAGVNSSAISQLGSAAGDATARKNAYTQAKASSQANTYSALGTLGSAAIMAFAF